jgi:UDP-glucose 4-epimerase
VRILLLGSSGLIGHAIHKAVAGAGIESQSVTRSTLPSLDLNDVDQIAALDLDGFDTVIHAAGVTDEEVVESPRDAILRATIGTAKFLQRCREAGIRRYVYVSSSHVYGPFEGVKDETSVPDPLTEYALCHFAVEQLVRRAVRQGGGCGLVVRPNAVFGMPPDLSKFRRWSLIPFQFPADLVKSGTIRIRSTGEQTRNFVSSEDIAEGIVAWLLTPQDEIRIWNPVGPLACSIYEFAVICANVYKESTGMLGKVEVGNEPATGSDFRLQSGLNLSLGRSRPEPYLREIFNVLLGS